LFARKDAALNAAQLDGDDMNGAARVSHLLVAFAVEATLGNRQGEARSGGEITL